MKPTLTKVLGFIAATLIFGFFAVYWFGNMLGSSMQIGNGILLFTIPTMVISGEGERVSE